MSTTPLGESVKASRPVMTVPKFRAAKGGGRRLTVLTAYDYLWAGLLDAAGADALLVGDSLAMVVQGKRTTLSVTMDEIVYHAEMVARPLGPRWSWSICRFCRSRCRRRTPFVTPDGFSKRPAQVP